MVAWQPGLVGSQGTKARKWNAANKTVIYAAAVGQKFIPHVLCMGFYFQNINKSFQMLAQGYEEFKNDGVLGNISR